MVLHRAHGLAVHPAAAALYSLCRPGGDTETFDDIACVRVSRRIGFLLDFDRRHDEDKCQVVLVALQKLKHLRLCIERNARVQGVADLFVPAERFEHFGRFAAYGDDLFPPRFQVSIDIFLVNLGKGSEKHAPCLFALLHVTPDLIGRKGKHRRHETDHGGKDRMHDGLAGPAFDRGGLRGIQPVLQDVEIEGAHVHGAKIMH